MEHTLPYKRIVCLLLAGLILSVSLFSCADVKDKANETALSSVTDHNGDTGETDDADSTVYTESIADTTEEDSTSSSETSTPESASTSEIITTPKQTTTPEATTTPKVTTVPVTSTSKIETTTEAPEPEPDDDGVRVNSFMNYSTVKVVGGSLTGEVQLKSLYDFRNGYGTPSHSPFSVLKREHSNGAITEYSPSKMTCLYGHSSTVYGNVYEGVVRVDAKGERQTFGTPGLIYILPQHGSDILMTFTAPADGSYTVDAVAQREWTVNNTGSRFFIELNGVKVVEEYDYALESTKEIVFHVDLQLKKGDKVYFGHDPLDEEGKGPSGMSDDAVIKKYTVRFNGEVSVPSPVVKELTHGIKMAKNESESVQITVNSIADVQGLRLVMTSRDVSGISVELLEEHLISTVNGDFPDPISPTNGTFNVSAGVNKTLLIRFNTTKNTPSGDYTYTFELRSPNGRVLCRYTVKLTVWRFALPDAPTVDTATMIHKDQIIRHEKIGSDKADEYYKLYYDLMLSYKFSPHDLPYDILDDRADAYMSDPRVTGFRINYNLSDDVLVRIYNKLKTNPVWLEKAYFYVYDEPNDVNALNTVKSRADRLNRLCPEIDILVAFFRNVKYDNNRDQIDFMSECVDVFCAKSAAWNPGWLPDPLGRGYFGDRMNELREKGNKIWWYVCWEPVHPYCNLQIDEIGVQHRELFWQSYLYDCYGFLYWASAYWHGTNDPWTDMATVKSLSPTVYGDGSLLYPGAKVGVKGACASLRLEITRDGIEDFDLMLLAEKYLGREWVVEKINKVTSSLVVHTQSDELFHSIRNAIGDELSKKV